MKKTIFFGLLALSAGLVVPALGRSPSIAKAEEFTSVGDKWFQGYNCTVESFKDKGLNQWSATGFTTEITPTDSATDVMVMYNTTVQGAGRTSSATVNAEHMFVFEKYLDEGGNPMPVADMIVITLRSAKDPTKSLSVVHRLHSNVWDAVSLSFTDQLEIHDDGYCYIKGTNQTTKGAQSAGTYNEVGKIFNKDPSKEAPLFGADYAYVQVLKDGTVQHSQYNVFGNILDSDFLAASRAQLSEDSPYYNMYTTEYAQSVLDALSTMDSGFGTSVMTIRYSGIRVNEKLRFRLRQIDNTWLGEGTHEPNTAKPFSWYKLDENYEIVPVYTGVLTHITDVIEPHNTYRKDDGTNSVDMSGWNDLVTHNDATWFANNSKGWDSKGIKLDTVQEKGFSVYTRCNASGQPWGDRYLYQDIKLRVLDGSPVLTESEDIEPLEFGTAYDLAEMYDVFAPAGVKSTSYKIDGEAFAGTQITGDGEDHEFEVTITDNADRTDTLTISLQHEHRFGDWVNEVPATCLNDGLLGHYQCQDCEGYFDEEYAPLESIVIGALGHSFGGEITYTWVGDQCTASWGCQRDGCNEVQTETVTGVYVEDTAPTCLEDGKGHYLATFSMTDFGTAETPANSVTDEDSATGHSFGGEISYSWVGNQCTASWECQHAGCNEVQTETVTGVYVEDTAPTCLEDGKGHYLATFSITDFGTAETPANSVTDEDSATGHSFGGEISYSWVGDQCTASWKCQHDGCDEEQTETVTGLFVEDTPATCTTNQKGHYLATFTIQEFGTNATAANSVEVPNTAGHTFEDVTYRWTDDHKCVAEHKCSVCKEVVVIQTVDGVFVEDTPATCTTNQKGHFTATFTVSGLVNQSTPENSYEVPNSKTQHTWSDPTYVWSNDNKTCTASRHCDNCVEVEEETVDVVVENGKYVARFTNTAFVTQYKTVPTKGGCGGDIVATSILVSTLALLGVGALLLKKRKKVR